MSAYAGQVASPSDYLTDTRKMVARGRRTSASSTTNTSTGVGVLRIDGLSLKSGRIYRVHTGGLGFQSTVAADDVGARITYATAGATATTASNQLKGAATWQRVPNTSVTQIVPLSALYIPAGDEIVSLLLCVHRNNGTGNVSMYGDAANFPIDLWVDDDGPDVGDTGISL